MIPFAVVGSDLEYQVNGKKLLGRKTKWGTIEGNPAPPKHTETHKEIQTDVKSTVSEIWSVSGIESDRHLPTRI